MITTDYIRLIATAKRNFFQVVKTDTAQGQAKAYDDIVQLINSIEEVLVETQIVPPPRQDEGYT